MPVRAFCLGLMLLLASAVVAQVPAWRWVLPAGVAPPPVPADNPMNAAKVALGRRLFYDGRLSVGGTMSCATCHQQHRAFASSTATNSGIGGNPGRRNVPGLANVGWITPLTWHDPAIQTLEFQMVTPLFGTNPNEMAARPFEILAQLKGDACYRRLFKAADPGGTGTIDIAHMANAIAAFERTLIAYNTPYDAFQRGDHKALSPMAQRGAAAFTRTCGNCHSGPNFSDGKFYAIAPVGPDADDRGLMEVTGAASDDGLFRTAPLRNVGLTAPYFHDGSVATLQDIIRRHDVAAKLDATTVRDLVAFLEGLTDEGFVKNAAFAQPGPVCEAKP
ncbi:di-heme enzyme [soil metagenome]